VTITEGTPTATVTSSPGLIACPDGTSSTAVAYPTPGPKEVNDCKRLLAGFEYTPSGSPAATAIAAADVKPCAADTYWGSEREINTGTFAALECTACPEGTGVTAQTNDAEPGAKVVNDCKKVYEGYWYNGIGSGDISTTTVRPCPANVFCPGWPRTATNIVTLGTAILPTPCPDGTQVDAGTVKGTNWFADNTAARAVVTADPASADRSGANGARTMADCNKQVAGWWYEAPGSGSTAISSSTVKRCLADTYCNTKGLSISPGTSTATVTTGQGVYDCPTGSGSAVGSKVINDCSRLKPGNYFTGGNVAGATPGPATIKQCPVKSYW
jgi:hypothetical protein